MDGAEGPGLGGPWGVGPAGAEPPATEQDDSFRVETATGERYVLEVSNPAQRSAEIDLECQAMEHVRAHGVPTPRLRPTRDGRLWSTIRDAAGQERVARLMTFAHGTP